MKAQLLAVPLVLALMLSPAFAAAASGTLSFTSPTSGSALNGVAAYTIAGTISPVPPAGTDNVNIQVTNPNSQLVDVQTVAVSASGTFTYSTNAGGSSAWTSGTYHILATDSNGATNTITFTYTATNPTPTGTIAPVIEIYVVANSLVFSGQTVQAEAMLVWNTNGTLVTASNTTVTTTLVPPSGSSSTLTASSSSSRGQYLYSYTVPAGSPDGAYLLQVVAIHKTSAGNFIGWGLGQFTVNSQVASASGVNAVGKNVSALSASIASISSSISSINSAVGSLSTSVGKVSTDVGTLSTAVSGLTSSVATLTTDVSNLQSAINTISSTVSTLSTSVSSISSGLQTLTSDVTGLQNTVNGLGNLSSQMTSLSGNVSSLSSTVSNEQTYILVVALIAAVTLVLELAILIRKLS